MTLLNTTPNNFIQIDEKNFQQVILEGSKQQTIIIDFNTQRAPESIEMSQTLENICSEHPDTIVLAKVDCDQPVQQQIAQQFGVQSLPTVVVFKNGEVANGFAGGQPEAEVRKVLAEYLPKPEDALLIEVAQLIEAERFSDALLPAKQTLELVPDHIIAQKHLIHVLLELGQNTEAEPLLSKIGLVDQDDYYQSLVAKLELNKQAAESPEIKALKDSYEQTPQDTSIGLKLAIQLHQAKQDEDALNLLMAILVKDLNAVDGDAKKTLMDILATMPAGDAVATQVRRKLYSLLY